MPFTIDSLYPFDGYFRFGSFGELFSLLFPVEGEQMV